jgi:hypothetical protein
MRRTAIVLALLGALVLSASAQAPVVPSYSTSGNPPYSPVTPSFGLPVICESGCSGGGGGAITAATNSYAVGALQDGADATEGTKADTAYAGSGSATVVSILKGIYNALVAALPAGSNIIGKVGIDQTTPGTTNGVVQNAGPSNVTATACSGTVTSGGAANNAFTAQTTLHGFTIANIDTTEVLWISFTTTAAASGTDSYPLPAATATTFAGFGSFTSPPGFGLNHALSVLAATTGHKFSCTWW